MVIRDGVVNIYPLYMSSTTPPYLLTITLPQLAQAVNMECTHNPPYDIITNPPTSTITSQGIIYRMRSTLSRGQVKIIIVGG
jgi:hypothetical protein